MTSGEFLMASSICHLFLPLSYTCPCLPTLNLHPSFAVPNLEGVGWSRGGCTESGAPCCIRNFWSSVMEPKNSYHPQKPCGGCYGVTAQACLWGWWAVKHSTASSFLGNAVWPWGVGSQSDGSGDILAGWQGAHWGQSSRITQKYILLCPHTWPNKFSVCSFAKHVDE